MAKANQGTSMSKKFIMHWFWTAMTILASVTVLIALVAALAMWPAIGIGLVALILFAGWSFLIACDTWEE